ncbi:paired amphipathic helix protein Sin3-like 6 [Medicago truncatula]|nr:paired amphipathic helix protein Sin3-like 6 [Medicago truncatula]
MKRIYANRPVVDYEYVARYVMKVKTRFQHAGHVYSSFLDILQMYRQKEKNLDEVIREVAILFQGHDDLIHEFANFLPLRG